jgi:N4-gp56 family major capsid protein
MANTDYPVNHPLAVKLWSKKLFQEALKQTWASKFMSKGSDSLIQIKDETQKSAGDRITVGLRMQLTGAGIQGDGTLEGNEEALVTYSDNVFIDQLRHAVRSAGKMSEQRVPFSIREEARTGLQDWWADRIDTWFINQVTGNTGQADTRFTGNQAAVEPDSDHLIAGADHDAETSLTASTTNALKLSDIDRLVAKAKSFTTGTDPIIRPVKVSGEDKYVLFIHPYQMYLLRTANASAVNNYIEIFRAAMMGGKYKDNPIVTGASFEYNNVIVHESTRIPVITGTPATGTASQFRRAVMCGAQAACIAYGRGSGPGQMDWTEEMFDYGNQLGVEAGCIGGLKKMRFNSKDFGTIALSTYAPAV